MSNYILRVLIAADQLVNALIGGNPDETLSSAAYRAEKEGRFWGFWIISQYIQTPSPDAAARSI